MNLAQVQYRYVYVHETGLCMDEPRVSDPDSLIPDPDPDPAFILGWIPSQIRIQGFDDQKSVLRIRIRIHRIHMFLGLMDPDPLVRDMDPDSAPDPSIIKKK